MLDFQDDFPNIFSSWYLFSLVKEAKESRRLTDQFLKITFCVFFFITIFLDIIKTCFNITLVFVIINSLIHFVISTQQRFISDKELKNRSWTVRNPSMLL